MSSNHPHMPNAVESTKREMLDAIGAEDMDELYEQIPERLRYSGDLDLPGPESELELQRHARDLLDQNETCEENLNFLGAGCWQHYVPPVCDEIIGQREFLTSEWGSPESDKGRNQAWFEFCSQLGELLELDAVGLPVYSWGNAAGFAMRMAYRLTDRTEVLVPETISPERLAVMENYSSLSSRAENIDLVTVAYDRETGLLDVEDLREKCSEETAAVYYESPTFLGTFESQGGAIADVAHENGAECIAGVDPSTLGLVDSPANNGADIVVGTTQPLGLHMNGGACSGFIASRDEEEYVVEFPTLLLSATETATEGEIGYAFMPEQLHRSSYGLREDGNDYTGTSVYLWTIANAVYMSLLGRRGFRELGELVVERSHYAADRLSRLDGVDVRLSSSFFKEFVVDFEGADATAAEVNERLREYDIFGGLTLADDFPELGDAALYCVTEIHTRDDIDRLVDAVSEVIES
ncbi:aminomethyl-transferring glycine dehydrogenase subunit GcvPA [Halogeometricum sp. CBA1124]|uniref:aminomethyl-transferring glycine dehydrogenase subunit GcvPA n=1 Tax=Halogeometricum sp. CBA1124 TaxID=2668071 RepID=UPI00142CBC9B|nr:aminomethyl-transferring glycine dehydrogenase subunit GcvPA [Halogeometricum sp. CBA1124]MUV56186.1 aminomethyl-transferring glycine dehydrogenase subunit GcvPA [Halogeometricum sp. CBA1124]